MDGQQQRWLGDTYNIILSTQASGGSMSITDSMALEGNGPPRHIHRCGG